MTTSSTTAALRTILTFLLGVCMSGLAMSVHNIHSEVALTRDQIRVTDQKVHDLLLVLSVQFGRMSTDGLKEEREKATKLAASRLATSRYEPSPPMIPSEMSISSSTIALT